MKRRQLMAGPMLVCSFLLSASVFAQEPVVLEKSQDLHRQIEELSSELQQALEHVSHAEGQTRTQMPFDDARILRGRLRALEERLQGLADEDAELLRRKLRSLASLVGNLETAATSLSAAGALPESAGRRRVSVGTFAVQATAPANDACVNAELISLGSEATGDTSLATQDGTATCGSSILSTDVWYRYVAPDYGYVSLDTFGSDFDTVISVHSACPGTTSNQLACNDDAFGVHSATQFYTYAGGEYWIRVGGFSGSTGTFVLHAGNGGGVSGGVVSASDQQPLTDGMVEIYDANGYYQGSDWTDAAGKYSVSGLQAGSYFLRTDGFDGRLDEVYDDVACGAYCPVTDGTAVGVTSYETTGGIDFALDESGSISGTVTHAATGDPISGVWIEVYSAQGDYLSDVLSDANGQYTVRGFVTGTYFVRADTSDYAGELYGGQPCNEGCDPTQGTPVDVIVSKETSGIDLALDRLGVMTGTVTESATGDPLADVYVAIYTTGGSWVRNSYTDTDGVFSIGGLNGTYVAVVNTAAYLDELYQDYHCAGEAPYGCDFAAATPLAVAVEETVTDVDFALEKLGAIEGTVTDAVTGDPLVSVRVYLKDSYDNYVQTRYTDSSGMLRFANLRPGDYFATTDLYYDEYINEVYDDVACPLSGCQPLDGTPIPVTLGTTTTGIDFALDPSGAITGTVSRASTGDPISYNATIFVWDASGQHVRTQYTDSIGAYQVGGLETGSYFVTVSADNYLGELYDDLPCPGGYSPDCDVTAGTAVAVTLSLTTEDVDFALDRLGSISGQVTHAAGGGLVYDAYVKIWDAAGSYVASGYVYSGEYTVDGLAPGTYFATVEDDYEYGFADQLYASLPCPGGAPYGCDPTSGTPLEVTLNTELTGVDFAVEALGVISGTVIDDAGNPLESVRVEVWTDTGSRAAYEWTNASGVYSIASLRAGRYFVSTENSQGFLDELYSDVPCLGGGGTGCDPTKGDAVAVADAVTTQVDFELRSLGGITGTVTRLDTGQAVAGVVVDAWNAFGQLMASASTGAAGTYSLDVGPGTYYLSTRNTSGLVDEVYDDVPCSGVCDPTTGSPVPVTFTVTGIDFALGSGLVFNDGFESGDLTQWPASAGVE